MKNVTALINNTRNATRLVINTTSTFKYLCIFVQMSRYYTRRTKSSHFRRKFTFSPTLLIFTWRKVLIFMKKRFIFTEKLLNFTDFIIIFTEYTKNQDFSRKKLLFAIILLCFRKIFYMTFINILLCNTNSHSLVPNFRSLVLFHSSLRLFYCVFVKY